MRSFILGTCAGLLFLILFGALFFFYTKPKEPDSHTPSPTAYPEETEILSTITKEGFPPPLQEYREFQGALLTRDNVFHWTNVERERLHLSPFVLSDELNAAAGQKLDDMFALQYFDHVSPLGLHASDLATNTGYEFIVIGENLALGNFLSERELIMGWMNSPGHRANILSPRYSDIGIATGQDVFQGQTVWIAVQIFASPLSACDKPHADLKETIALLEEELDALYKSMAALKNEIDSLHGQQNDRYSELVREYNVLVERYNTLLSQLRSSTDTYNQQVALFNSCLDKVSL